MDASRSTKPRKDQEMARETLVIKTETEFSPETANDQFPEPPSQDEASGDKSNEGRADQSFTNGRDESRTEDDYVFTPYVLINYPQANKLWDESATRIFLNMYKELNEMYEKGESNLRHRQRFVVIAENLKKRGFDYTTVQVENRFKSLKRSYQKAMQEDVLNQQGKTKPSHPSSQYHLYAEDMHEIFRECNNETREAAPNSFGPEFHMNDTETRGKAKKRKLVEISTEDQTQSDGDKSESRSEDFHCGLPSFIQQLQNKIPETITCTTEECKFTEDQDSTPSFCFPIPNEACMGDVVESLQLLRDDYNTWQKIREEGKNRRHQEKMRLYSQLIHTLTIRK